MPKGFTKQQLESIAGMVRAAYGDDGRAYQSHAEQLRAALINERKTVLNSGVPAAYFDSAQKGELVRALNETFPQKDLVGEYHALHGDSTLRIERAYSLPNPIHRGAVLELLGENNYANIPWYNVLDRWPHCDEAYDEGIKLHLSRIPPQYAIEGKIPNGLVYAVGATSSPFPQTPFVYPKRY